MRRLLLMPILLLVACEWQPDQIPVDEESTLRTVNIALNDSLPVIFSGTDLEVIEHSDETIARVELLTDTSVVLVGVGIGETSILLNYTNDSAIAVIAHIKVLVSNGILLNLHYNEPEQIRLANYLTPAQILRVDSIRAVVSGIAADMEISTQVDSAVFTIRSLTDGESILEIFTYDSSGILVAPLIFKTETTIRKMVLGEIFTNAGCVNCPTANENLDHLYDEYPENFTAIRYHVFWTDPFDPMNLYNPSETEARRVYYGSSFEAPRLFLDGGLAADFDQYQILSNTVAQSMEIGTRTYISYTDILVSSDSLFLDISIKNFDSVYESAICWTVLAEDSIEYVGTNGETIHNQAMRDMTFTEFSAFSSEVTLTHSLKLTPDFSMDAKYHLVTFIQDGDTREILQTNDLPVTGIE